MVQLAHIHQPTAHTPTAFKRVALSPVAYFLLVASHVVVHLSALTAVSTMAAGWAVPSAFRKYNSDTDSFEDEAPRLQPAATS